MSRSLRIAIADDEVAVQDFYAQTLQALGHEVVCRATTGEQLVAGCRRALPDLVISDSQMSDMSAAEAAGRLACTRPTPWIVFATGEETEWTGRSDTIVGHLHKPLRQAELHETIPRSLERFAMVRREADEEAARLRQSLQDHRLVERAKSNVMHDQALDEGGALRWLQEHASDRGLSLADFARKVTRQPTQGR